MAAPKPLTVRFRPALRRRLEFTARAQGISMNRLVEEAVEKDLRIRSGELEAQLEDLLATLRTYRADEIEEDIEAFAASEVREEDPTAARRVPARDPGK